jgi:hypothetical protein
MIERLPYEAFRERDTQLQELKRLIERGKISDQLRQVVEASIIAIEKDDIPLASELTSVKSLVGNNMDNTNYPFSEASEYNERQLGRSAYSLLDAVHHQLAFSIDEMPSGVVVISAGGYLTRGRSSIQHPLVALINQEFERERIAATNLTAHAPGLSKKGE